MFEDPFIFEVTLSIVYGLVALFSVYMSFYYRKHTPTKFIKQAATLSVIFSITFFSRCFYYATSMFCVDFLISTTCTLVSETVKRMSYILNFIIFTKVLLFLIEFCHKITKPIYNTFIALNALFIISAIWQSVLIITLVHEYQINGNFTDALATEMRVDNAITEMFNLIIMVLVIGIAVYYGMRVRRVLTAMEQEQPSSRDVTKYLVWLNMLCQFNFLMRGLTGVYFQFQKERTIMAIMIGDLLIHFIPCNALALILYKLNLCRETVSGTHQISTVFRNVRDETDHTASSVGSTFSSWAFGGTSDESVPGPDSAYSDSAYSALVEHLAPMSASAGQRSIYMTGSLQSSDQSYSHGHTPSSRAKIP